MHQSVGPCSVTMHQLRQAHAVLARRIPSTDGVRTSFISIVVLIAAVVQMQDSVQQQL